VVLVTLAGPVETRATAQYNTVVTVYRGQTAISIESGNPDATSEYPVLTVEQIIELATAPELFLYP
jgi:hypothetical protein